LAYLDITPPEGWGQVDVPVLGSNKSRDGDTDCDDPGPVLETGQHRPDQALEFLHHCLGWGVAEGSITAGRGDDLAAQPDHRSPQPVRRNVDGKGAGAIW
jgi:hypothetical protein